MRRRWPELLLAGVAIVAGVFAWRDWRDAQPRFSFDRTSVVLNDLPTGLPNQFELRLHNHTGDVIRVVGSGYT